MAPLADMEIDTKDSIVQDGNDSVMFTLKG